MFHGSTEVRLWTSVKLIYFVILYTSLLAVARKQPVPEIEKAIGTRLRGYRESKLISQTAFALHAGLSRENLAKYEFGVVPLPYAAGEAVCRAHNINPEWLATGSGPQFPFIENPRSELAKLSPRMLFSHFYLPKKRSKDATFQMEDDLVTCRIIIMAYKDAAKQFKAGKMAEPLFRSIESQMLTLKKLIEDSLSKK